MLTYILTVLIVIATMLAWLLVCVGRNSTHGERAKPPWRTVAASTRRRHIRHGRNAQ